MLQVEQPADELLPAKKKWSNFPVEDEHTTTTFKAEPDVVVVVGGKEFHEHSLVLRSWSQFFDKAFRNYNGMITTPEHKLRFDIPHRKPEEWEVLTSLFSKQNITVENYEIILSWSRELEISEGLAGCDKFISAYLERMPQREAYVQPILDLLSQSIEYGLPKSKQVGITAVQLMLKLGCEKLSKDHFKQITNCVVSDNDCRTKLWRYMIVFLPDDFPIPEANNEEDVKKLYSMIECSVFPYLLYSGMQKKILEHQVASALHVANTTGDIKQVKSVLSNKPDVSNLEV